MLAGSARYSGAGVLAAFAGMRSGAGLVTLGIPKGLNEAVIKVKPLEVMTLPLPQTRESTLSFKALPRISEFLRDSDVMIIGPGMGLNRSTAKLVCELCCRLPKTTVLDADGITALSKCLALFKKRRDKKAGFVFTPHPGEMARLTGKSVAVIQRNRKKAAEEFAKEYRVTVVLKGHNTVVCDHLGNLYINKTGNPGMATAGSGDVLSGMIGAFMAQGLSSFQASKYAVYVHGLAGDLAAKEKTQISLIASDIIDKIPEAVRLSS